MKKFIFLPVLLVISILIFAAAGAYLKYDLFPTLQMETAENVITLPFVLLTDEQLSFRFSTRLEAYQNPTEPTIPTSAPTQPSETEAPTVPEETEPIPTETEPTEPPYIELDDSWFDDALFIGESRVGCLRNSARLGGADYFCGSSETVFSILKLEAADRGFYKQTLRSLLSGKQYGKIIIHLGINECSNYPDDFQAQYQAIVDLIRTLQPDAYIILHSIMPVTKGYASEPRLQPSNIARYNEQIQLLVTDDRTRYIDVSQWCADEEGFLRPELTNDGCHPHPEGNLLWAQWIKEACGWLNIPE